MAKKEKLCGEAGFNAFYENLFCERWQNLKNSMLSPVNHCQWQNGSCKSYFLDSASILAAASIPLERGKKILDLCAAPGGKTLILASLMDSDATLVSNDRSPSRKMRLVKVCDESLPSEIRERVNISCSDGAKWCTRQQECFDRILLDAPCSSERHVLADAKYLAQWSASRVKTLAMEQWALLSSAFRLLAPGGFLLYSTCALSPAENDGVVERLFKKFDNARCVFAEVDTLPDVCQKIEPFSDARLPPAEKTEYGFHVLPDTCAGAGPLYFSLITKYGEA